MIITPLSAMQLDAFRHSQEAGSHEFPLTVMHEDIAAKVHRSLPNRDNRLSSPQLNLIHSYIEHESGDIARKFLYGDDRSPTAERFLHILHPLPGEMSYGGPPLTVFSGVGRNRRTLWHNTIHDGSTIDLPAPISTSTSAVTARDFSYKGIHQHDTPYTVLALHIPTGTPFYPVHRTVEQELILPPGKVSVIRIHHVPYVTNNEYPTKVIHGLFTAHPKEMVLDRLNKQKRGLLAAK